jgi:hypothetical protein
LGFSYLEGRGVARDDVLAHMWLTLSAENGYEHAPKVRDAVAQRLTPAQRARSRELVEAWRAKQAGKPRVVAPSN